MTQETQNNDKQKPYRRKGMKAIMEAENSRNHTNKVSYRKKNQLRRGMYFM